MEQGIYIYFYPGQMIITDNQELKLNNVGRRLHNYNTGEHLPNSAYYIKTTIRLLA